VPRSGFLLYSLNYFDQSGVLPKCGSHFLLNSILRIRDVYLNSTGINFIQLTKNYKVLLFTQKIVNELLKIWFGIRDRKKSLPDPGVKKAPDPGCGSATLAKFLWYIFISFLISILK
jgi:hypothetical protein